MRVNGIWQFWATINMPLWFGFELGTPRNEKGIVGGIKPAMRGILKGVAASLFPPIGIYYAYEAYNNWETELD